MKNHLQITDVNRMKPQATGVESLADILPRLLERYGLNTEPPTVEPGPPANAKAEYELVA